MKVAFCTLGCKVNQYETNGMIQSFKESGYEIVNFDSKADIYIINTCTVTNMSDRKSRQMINKARKENLEAIVVALGCYVQVAKDQINDIENVDLILGNAEKKDIVQIVEKYLSERKAKEDTKNLSDGFIENKNLLNKDIINNDEKIVETIDILHDTSYEEFGDVLYTEKTRAVIKVQDGCDRFCTYCIIPYARGRVRSRNPKNVLSEIQKIANEGIKEVVITGIHIASYGKDFDNDYKLINLLEEINRIDGIQRIRLGSIEPILMSKEFLDRLSKLEKICHHFHLSLQSGCTETLKRMNRRYTAEEFYEIANRIRLYFEDVILTTDIIVGFPGETDEEFEETYNFLKKINFYKMHIFKYSMRAGTKASIMKNQISGEIKEKRSNILIELSNENENRYLESYIGKEIEVLFEEKKDEFYSGHTANYLEVKYKSNDYLEGIIKKVIGKSVEGLCLIAK